MGVAAKEGDDGLGVAAEEGEDGLGVAAEEGEDGLGDAAEEGDDGLGVAAEEGGDLAVVVGGCHRRQALLLLRRLCAHDDVGFYFSGIIFSLVKSSLSATCATLTRRVQHSSREPI